MTFNTTPRFHLSPTLWAAPYCCRHQEHHMSRWRFPPQTECRWCFFFVHPHPGRHHGRWNGGRDREGFWRDREMQQTPEASRMYHPSIHGIEDLIYPCFFFWSWQTFRSENLRFFPVLGAKIEKSLKPSPSSTTQDFFPNLSLNKTEVNIQNLWNHQLEKKNPARNWSSLVFWDPGFQTNYPKSCIWLC